MRVAYPSVGTFVSLHEVGLMPLSASLAITLKMPGTGILSETACFRHLPLGARIRCCVFTYCLHFFLASSVALLEPLCGSAGHIVVDAVRKKVLP